MFTIQCYCLGDWLKVKEGGPWLFRQNAVCIEEYDGLSSPDSIDLNFFDTWIQVHKLPIGYRNEALIKNLTEKKVGKVLKVVTDVNGMGNFVRVRVRLDVRKVLARAVSISRGGEREIYLVQYEKIPKFCGSCGLFGHSYLECGSGEHDESKLKWGDFLKADRETWHGRGVGSRGSGRGGGRAGGARDGFGGTRGRDPSGRGIVQVPWRHNARIIPTVNASDPELTDTATSPGKGQDMDLDKSNLVNPAAKRALEMGMELDKNNNIQTGNAIVDEGNAMVTDGSAAPVIHEVANEKDRTKRTKKDGANSSSLGSAESHEDSVRSQ
jgi:hypothetical protein